MGWSKHPKLGMVKLMHTSIRGFHESKCEPALYAERQFKSDNLIVFSFIDYLVFTENDEQSFEDLKKEMM